MSAVAASSMIAEDRPSAPPITPETRAQLAKERLRLLADPARPSLPAEMNLSAKHVYRAKPGTYRRIKHNLPMPPEEKQAGDEKRFNYDLRIWKAKVAAAWYPDLEREAAAKKLTAYLNKVRDALGDTRFKFTQVPRHQECFYATNDEVIAGYIDDLIARGVGEFAQVYREGGRTRVVAGLGTEQAKAFPNTASGRALAFEYANEHGITAIEIVEE
jgi:hypothetical protein